MNSFRIFLLLSGWGVSAWGMQPLQPHPFQTFVRQEDLSWMRLLIELGRQLETQAGTQSMEVFFQSVNPLNFDVAGWNLFHYAVAYSRSRRVFEFLSKWVQFKLDQLEKSQRFTPLMLAVLHQNEVAIEFLVNHHMKLTGTQFAALYRLQPKDGLWALQQMKVPCEIAPEELMAVLKIAVEYNDVGLMILLKESSRIEFCNIVLDSKEVFYSDVLRVAIERGYLEFLKEFVPEFMQTLPSEALFHAIEWGQVQVLEFLLSLKKPHTLLPQMDVKVVHPGTGNAPLHHAVIFPLSTQRHEMIRLLLLAKAPINQKNQKGQAAFDLAREYSYLDTQSYLLKFELTQLKF